MYKFNLLKLYDFIFANEYALASSCILFFFISFIKNIQKSGAAPTTDLTLETRLVA